MRAKKRTEDNDNVTTHAARQFHTVQWIGMRCNARLCDVTQRSGVRSPISWIVAAKVQCLKDSIERTAYRRRR